MTPHMMCSRVDLPELVAPTIPTNLPLWIEILMLFRKSGLPGKAKLTSVSLIKSVIELLPAGGAAKYLDSGRRLGLTIGCRSPDMGSSLELPAHVTQRR